MHRVEIIESERGWGSKVDFVKHFDSYEEARSYIAEFNSGNTEKEVPDWYMYARYVGEIDDKGNLL